MPLLELIGNKYLNAILSVDILDVSFHVLKAAYKYLKTNLDDLNGHQFSRHRPL